jgi:hypothetical protein
MKKHEFFMALNNICVKYQESGGDIANIDISHEGVVINFTKETKRAGWVEEMLFNLQEEFPLYCVEMNDEKRRITVVSFIDELCQIHGTGIALCSSSDKFNPDVGIAVAYAKYTGEKIPDYI